MTHSLPHLGQACEHVHPGSILRPHAAEDRDEGRGGVGGPRIDLIGNKVKLLRSAPGAEHQL